MGVDPDSYRRWRAIELGRRVEAIEQAKIFALAGPLAGRRVLDIGTGDGSYAIAAARQGAARVVGVDRNLDMLAAARRRATQAGVSTRVEFVTADAARLPFPDRSFDRVLAVTMLCVCEDPQAVLVEMARVLEPGGIVVIGELGAWSSWALARRIRATLGSASAVHWQRARFWTLASLRDALVSAGFEPERSASAIRFPPIERLAGVLAPLDRLTDGLGSVGAAFIAWRARVIRG